MIFIVVVILTIAHGVKKKKKKNKRKKVSQEGNSVFCLKALSNKLNVFEFRGELSLEM